MVVDPAFALLSFSPSSGIGLYAHGSALCGFDLVTDEDYEIGPVGERSPDATAAFASHAELITFVTAEYLRDKKHTYYSTLLTTDFDDEELRDDIVKFLDAEELAPLAMASDVVTTLREIGSSFRAWKCLQLAERLGCVRVMGSLWMNFTTLLGPPSIVRTPPPVLIEQRPPATLTRSARPHREEPRWVPLTGPLGSFEPDTQQYITALLAGDASVQQHFFLEFGRRLMRRVPPALFFMAEDLVLNALIRTFESLREHGFKEPWHLRSFAVSVLENHIKNAYRTEQRYIPLGERLFTPVDRTVDMLLWQSRETSVVPLDADLIIAESLDLLQLREPRAAIVLHLRLEGQTFAEIAGGLRISEAAARRLSKLGIQWLREHVAKRPGTSEPTF